MRLNQDESKLVSDRVRAKIQAPGDQTALAHKAGLIPQTLSHLLHGRIYWSDEHIEAVARALGVSGSDLTAGVLESHAQDPHEAAVERSRTAFLARHASDLSDTDCAVVAAIRSHSLPSAVREALDDEWWLGLVRLHRTARERVADRASGKRPARKG